MINKEEKGEGVKLFYFYLDNGSNVCGLEFNYKNGEEEGDLSLKGEKEDKKLEEGEETKQYKMEGLEKNNKADDKAFYNASSSLALKWNQKKAGGLTLSSRTGRGSQGRRWPTGIRWNCQHLERFVQST